MTAPAPQPTRVVKVRQRDGTRKSTAIALTLAEYRGQAAERERLKARERVHAR